MKTSLKLLSFLSALGILGASFAQFLGVPVPAPLDAAHIYAAFVVASILLIAFSDYSDERRRPARLVARYASLARTERHRLAA